MHEVEAKVRLTEAQYQRMKREIPKTAKRVGKSVKRDLYFGDWRRYVMRIREENGQNVLAFKVHRKNRGVESNEELEWPIDDAKRWRQLLEGIGFPLSISKAKECESYWNKPFTIELNRVRGLGRFLEIERLVGRKSEIPKARAGVVALFGKLGFRPRDFERKLYLELLTEKGKNRKA